MLLREIEMNKKLDEKLQIINKEKPILNDEDLMNALETIIDTEVAKSIEDMDTDLINSAVEFKLSLAGVNLEKIGADSEKHIEDYLSKIHETSIEDNKIKQKRKIAKPLKYIIAVAAILATMAVTVFATCMILDFDLMDLKTFLGLEREIEHNDGNYSLEITDTRRDYSSLEDFINNEDVEGLLLPTDNVKQISVFYATDKYIVLDLNIEKSTLKIVSPNKEHFDKQSYIKIGDYSVVILKMDQQIQGVWVYKNNCYYVNTSSIEQLTNIINQLEENEK